MLLEGYARAYVKPYYLAVTPKDNTNVMWSEPDSGNYTFSQNSCLWLIRWYIERPSPTSFTWINIFKIGENSSFFTPKIDVLFSSLTARVENGSLQPEFDIDRAVLYENNRIGIRDQLMFPSNGTYQLTLYITINFYQDTFIGYVPSGELTIPLKTTYVATDINS